MGKIGTLLVNSKAARPAISKESEEKLKTGQRGHLNEGTRKKKNNNITQLRRRIEKGQKVTVGRLKAKSPVGDLEFHNIITEIVGRK